ncbi:hypothetical protein BP6252_07862 [Coleophoma cylindrospora]|uniref:Velvet domain-containing protein n=1 Tax=Coleophoma cylindrospora TaxID=1849047 RepID=A0A3D8RB63_9HELO|nr:hypothetical protein BP6252_07862 [Coleophoma cylindrospora]
MASATASRPTTETIQRVTKEGRKLTYCLSVIQQPERARACGSGAKSSADRRPVDPPPVVELRIFDGEPHEDHDITFAYEANFFLFATLEVARPIARGRVQPASNSQVPVLTGMPVSGMAYLDRPKEAGYFIFPDLSVRHEGKYCLSFNLYEETKKPKDTDAEPANQEGKPKGPGAPDSSFDWRLEVKSSPFTVFSAKKFPGLAESTALSRTVAEQGCRVRIRRDVRMRRREGKGEDFDEHAEDDYARVGRPVSQDEAFRQRSLSGSPVDPQRQPYAQDRRGSGEYPPQPYQDYTPSPVAPHAAPQGGNLGFGGASYGQQYQAPPPPPAPVSQSQYAQPPPMRSPAQSLPPQQYPSAPYHQAPYHQAPQYHQPPPPPSQQTPYGYAERQPYPSQQPPQHYPAPPPPPPREYEPEYRRPSVQYAPPPPLAPQGSQYPAVDSNYNRSGPPSSYRSYPPRPHSPSLPSHVNLAPLKMAPMEPKYQELPSPAGPPPSSSNRFPPPLPSPSYDRGQERSSQYGQYPPAMPAPEPPRNGNKRSFDNVFGASTADQPLYNGMRPSNVHDQQQYDDEDDMSMEQLKMQYKRADGSSYSRELPALE